MSWRDRAVAVEGDSDWRARAKKPPGQRDPRWLERSQLRQEAARVQQELADEEARPLRDTIAHGALGAADAMSLGLADEARGAAAFLAAPWQAIGGAVQEGRNPVEALLNVDVGGAYRRARDVQREATAMAKEQSPGAYGTGELVGTVAPGLVPGGAVARTAANQGIKQAAATGAKIGAASGAAGGFGEGEGAADSLKGATVGALAGAALGGALGSGAGVATKYAPAVLTKSRELPSVDVARIARKGGAALLDLAAKGGAENAPKAAGAAIGGQLGGPLGAGVGAHLGDEIAGGAGRAAAAKITALAERLRGKPPAVVEAALADVDEPTRLAVLSLVEDVGTRDISPSGLELATLPGDAVTRESPTAALAALKERMGAKTPATPAGANWTLSASDLASGTPIPGRPPPGATRADRMRPPPTGPAPSKTPPPLPMDASGVKRVRPQDIVESRDIGEDVPALEVLTRAGRRARERVPPSTEAEPTRWYSPQEMTEKLGGDASRWSRTAPGLDPDAVPGAIPKSATAGIEVQQEAQRRALRDDAVKRIAARAREASKAEGAGPTQTALDVKQAVDASVFDLVEAGMPKRQAQAVAGKQAARRRWDTMSSEEQKQRVRQLVAERVSLVDAARILGVPQREIAAMHRAALFGNL